MQEKTTLVAQIVASFAARPDATVDSIVALATRLTAELGQTQPVSEPQPLRSTTHLTAESAVTRDRIFCLCCGKGFTMLKRHLGAEHGMTEEAYREAYHLAEDYPLVAPSYSERKANYARSVGFGKYDRNTAEVG